jgi:hypothetical protein
MAEALAFSMGQADSVAYRTMAGDSSSRVGSFEISRDQEQGEGDEGLGG